MSWRMIVVVATLAGAGWLAGAALAQLGPARSRPCSASPPSVSTPRALPAGTYVFTNEAHWLQFWRGGQHAPRAARGL